MPGQRCLEQGRTATTLNTHPLDWFDITRGIKGATGWRHLHLSLRQAQVCEPCGHSHDPGDGYTLTVHHLDGDPFNNSYNNLVALCQRCHLHIQAAYRPGQMMLPGVEPPIWMQKRNLLIERD